MLLYRTYAGWLLERNPGETLLVPAEAAKGLTKREDLFDFLAALKLKDAHPAVPPVPRAPIENQEVWAAGVTYFRSRSARMAESEGSGAASFYDRVYEADRPELFMKSTAHRVSGPGEPVRIRRDSKWNVPEPELALLVSPHATILGYTIGNDMSSRDIEGENPLYLPQAKTYDRSCALGPAILVTKETLAPETAIRLTISRDGAKVFEGSTTLAAMKRKPTELVEYLYRETTFPDGCFLLTGTGIIPQDDFTLLPGDEVEMSIDGIGILKNTVEQLS